MAVSMKPLARLGVVAVLLAIAAGCAPQSSEVIEPSLEATASQSYPATQNGLVWIADGRLTERGDALRKTLAWAETSGVCSTSLGVTEIDNRLAQGGAENLAAADTLLTEGLVRYANEVDGRNKRDRATLIAAASDAADFRRFLAGLVPDDSAYGRLRGALNLYTALANSGGWERIPAGPALKPDMTHAQIGGLRRRLDVTRDLRAGDLQSPVFDAKVEAAVRRFQARNGLAVDGIVGQETRAALNVPADMRAVAIARSLCRYPDLVAKQIGTAIIVNVPGAELRFFRDGELSFSSRVIVGRTDWPTPIISDAISAVELNPYWNIPPRIAQIEVIPRIIEDPGYLQSHGIRVLSVGGKSPRELDPAKIDWTSVGPGSPPFRLRQDPGPQNPMGVVKFRLSNPDHVFLHDTPAHQLFERAKRGLSHGCVRVQDALRLAKLILEARSDTPPNGFEQALEGGAPVTIRLREPVPVHLVAISAWVDADGAVQFRNDPTRDLAEKSCIASLNTVAGIL